MKVMKNNLKRILSMGTALVMSACLFSGCSSSSAATSSAASGSNATSSSATETTTADGEGITLKLASMNGEDHPSARAWQYLKDELESRTDGYITCELYFNGALGADQDNIEQVMNGAPMVACAGTPLLGDFVSDIMIVGAPYIFEDEMDYAKVADTEIWQNIKDQFATEVGMHLGDLQYCGYRVVVSNQEIHTPEDMEGMKLRAPSSTMYWEIAQAMTGGSATTLSFSEQYNGLQQGVIDGCEPTYPDMYDLKLYEVASRVAETDHMLLTSIFYTSESVYQSLPEEYQTVMDEVFTEAAEIYSEDNIELNNEIHDLLTAEGITFDEVDIDAFKEATEVVYTKFPDWSENLRENFRAQLGYDD